MRDDAKKKRRIPIWLVLIILAPGLIAAVVMGLWAYVAATTRPLHPDPDAVSSVTLSPPAQDMTSAVAQARQIARAGLLEQNLPGLSVAVGVGGRLVWAEGFGWADIENKVPVAPDTRFRIGTASTALTSAAVGLLLEQQRQALDERIQTYVPEFPDKQWPVTLRQVMAHLGGVRNDGGDEGPLLAQRCERPVEGVQRVADYPLLFEPGTSFRYSSYGWLVVSAAVDAAADEPFLSFMRRQVFEPLGMDDTMPESSTDSVAGRATPYFPRFAADTRYGPDPMRPIDYSCYAGASVFLSTSSDLVRFIMAINSGALLQPTTVELLQTSQRLTDGTETGYGLGWQRESVELAGRPTTLIGHDGTSLGGMVASFMTFPEHGIVVAVMSNTSYAGTHDLAVQIAQAFVTASSRR
jgi:serine beta-lactamase-like protein LACTB